MQAFEIFRVIAGMELIVLLLFVFLTKNKSGTSVSLAYTACGIVVAGILFGEELYIGYSLIVLGLILGIIDLLLNPRSRKPSH